MYLADEYPEIGVVAPASNGASVSLVLNVSDVDARAAAAVEHGGRLAKEVAEAYGSRNATIIDPFGHRWMLQQPLTTVPAAEAPPAPWHQGDVGYVSIQVPDADRAAAFYTAVLGWEYEKRGEDSRHVRGQSMSIGIFGGQQPPNLYCAYAVGDADAAIERVRAAGGTAEAPTEKPWGRSADCVDNQGTAFSVFAPRADDPGERPPVNGAHARRRLLPHLQRSRFRARPRVLRRRSSGGRSRGVTSRTAGRSRTSRPWAAWRGGRPEQRVAPMWLVNDIEDAARAGAGCRRHGDRDRAAAVRARVRVRRRPGHPLLPRPALAAAGRIIASGAVPTLPASPTRRAGRPRCSTRRPRARGRPTTTGSRR